MRASPAGYVGKEERKMSLYNKDNPQSLQQMFGSIAQQYDKTNAILSFQMHKLWNKKLIRTAMEKQHPSTYLDLCCGTGEIAFKYLKRCHLPCKAYLLDFCPEMLCCAKERANHLNLQPHTLTYLQADAQKIPLAEESIESATLAYGIRNIPHPQQCFNEIYRVLNTGGTVGILELTQPTQPFIKAGHKLYLKTILPIMGQLVTSNREAYEYLCNSIHSFISPQELESMLKLAGFKQTSMISLMGGIATILVAKKGN